MITKFFHCVLLVAGFSGPALGQTRINEATTAFFSHQIAPACTQIQVDEFREFHDGRCAIRVGNDWGFIDTAGNIRISPGKYQYYMPKDNQVFPRFFNRRCPVLGVTDSSGRSSPKIGFIDPGGRLVIACRYDRIPEPPVQKGPWQEPGIKEQLEDSFFAEGFLNVVEEPAVLSAYDRCATIDTAGRRYQLRPVAQACPLRNNRTQCYKNGGYGYIDAWGQPAIEPRYAAAADFSEGKAAVAVRDSSGNLLWGVIDTAGRALTDFIFPNCPGPFREGNSVVELPDGHLGILIVAPGCAARTIPLPALRCQYGPGFSGAYLLPAGNSPARTGFDTSGQALRLPPEWRFAGNQIHAGLILVKNTLENTFGMITPDGLWKIPPIFTQLRYFQDGRAWAEGANAGKRLEGFINLAGEWVILKQP